MVTNYHLEDLGGAKVAGAIVDALDQVAHEGARCMLQRALEAEVDEFLGRERHQRGREFRGYRNGYGQERTVGIGTWAVPVRSTIPKEFPQLLTKAPLPFRVDQSGTQTPDGFGSE